MEWFRMYSEFCSDPKVQSMSEVMQRRLIMLLCLRCSNTLVTLQDDEIAFALRIDETDLAQTKELFMRKCFIDSAWEIQNWDKRQFVSDSSAARVAKHRASKKEYQNADENNGNVTVTPQIQNRTDTEHIKPIVAKTRDDVVPQEFAEAWEIYPRRPGASKKDALKAWNARLATGVGPELLLAGVKRYANFVKVMQTQPQYIKQPATFLGPGDHYLDSWVVPENNVERKNVQPWWSSDQLILLEGKKYKLAPYPGESIHEFKGRVQVAIDGGKKSTVVSPILQVETDFKRDMSPAAVVMRKAALGALKTAGTNE